MCAGPRNDSTEHQKTGSAVEDRKPIVVVGAGAAGLMAAIFAASGAAPVLLLERTAGVGRKILISGGGRCNVLPSTLRPGQYVTASSPNTLKKMLLSWPLGEQRRFFEETLGIRLALEPETGKLFPESNRAKDVRDGLVSRAREQGAEVCFGAMVRGIEPVSNGWLLCLDDGSEREAAAVIIATGGLSVAPTGSDGTGLRILEKLGHRLNDTYPALTPLTADPPRHAPLAGISLNVRLAAPGAAGAGARASGGFLFTHRGYSGPSVLDISHLAVRSREGERQPILVRWTALDEPEWEAAFRAGGSGTVAGVLRRHLPERLADALIAESAVAPDRALSQLSRDERSRLIVALTGYPLPWTGDEGYRKAEVTGGGVDLSEVDPRTLESRIHPGLFICGEALDAFGPIGGYNFAWAWATGRAAGMGAASS
jgi:predicted Rossmann fold flavoprotein